ncbi:MAG: histidinol dehydrogenase [Actinomycetota bacterium]|nr:histidinol dehydrogenase [Actinomycetota bacterium]
MLKLLDLRNIDGDYLAVLPRPKSAATPPIEAVKAIVDDVRNRGDEAIIELTKRFDKVELAKIEVSHEEILAAYERLDPALRRALEVAASAIEGYYRAEVHEDRTIVQNQMVIHQMTRPVDVAGCYVPGGKARYPSSVLMTAIPARVAGVEKVILCSPPTPDGNLDDGTLAAAYIAKVDHVYKVGGAQAVAAMAYGTDSIQKADVIVGPGNVYVSQAKRLVSDVVGIPMSYAGPSEVVVVADSSVDPTWAIMDVIVQAEHGPDGLAWLVTWDEDLANRADGICKEILSTSPRHTETMATLEEGGYVALVRDRRQAMEVSNAIAPEHLEILTDDYKEMLSLIKNAGAVFLGRHAPASVGDYLAGPSHVLPTNGTAKFASALSLVDFQKRIHAVEVGAAAMDLIGGHLQEIAAAEGLWAHGQSSKMRMGRP